MVAPYPKLKFADLWIEATAFADAANTAPQGDFRYGIALRRTGKQFYAFAISPRSQSWYVLKSSATRLDVLAQGKTGPVPGAGGENKLRAEARAGADLPARRQGGEPAAGCGVRERGGRLLRRDAGRAARPRPFRHDRDRRERHALGRHDGRLRGPIERVARSSSSATTSWATTSRRITTSRCPHRGTTSWRPIRSGPLATSRSRRRRLRMRRTRRRRATSGTGLRCGGRGSSSMRLRSRRAARAGTC